MSKDISNQRLIENEQIVRDQNQQATAAIKKYFHEESETTQTPVAFICECSDLDCEARVNISIDAYEKLHKRKDRFVVYPGHVTDQVERVVDTRSDFAVVEKPAVASA